MNAAGWMLVASSLALVACSSDVQSGAQPSPSPNAPRAKLATPKRVPPNRAAPKPVAQSQGGGHPEQRAKATSLLAEAQALYEAASAIVNNTPSNADQSSIMASPDGPAGRFYAHERKYQDATQSGPPVTQIADRGTVSALMDLATADSFLYGAVQSAVASCNEHDARLNLKVAKALIAEVRRDLSGTASDEWTPPDITSQVNDASRCGS